MRQDLFKRIHISRRIKKILLKINCLYNLFIIIFLHLKSLNKQWELKKKFRPAGRIFRKIRIGPIVV